MQIMQTTFYCTALIGLVGFVTPACLGQWSNATDPQQVVQDRAMEAFENQQ